VQAWKEHEKEHDSEWKWGDKDFKWEVKGAKKGSTDDEEDDDDN
jgi:hypothetical protein